MNPRYTTILQYFDIYKIKIMRNIILINSWNIKVEKISEVVKIRNKKLI